MWKYLLERIKDCEEYRKGERIWAYSHCTGWRVIEKVWEEVPQRNYSEQFRYYV